MRGPAALIALVAAGCAANGASLAAAEDASRVVVGERLALRSEITGEDRPVLLHRPPGWRRGDRHPVVYLLDPEAHFVHAAGLIQFLATQGRMPSAIVVGVGNVDRSRDLTPTRVPAVAGSGGADRFLDVLERELIPAVEAELGARPYRVLVGHSYGGLFTLHALATRPELFDAYVSVSPSLYWGDSLMLARARQLFAARPELETALYVAVGGEGQNMVDSNRAFAELLRAGAPAGVRWRYEELPAEDHGSVVHRAIYRGLEHVFDGWRPPAGVESLEALEAHHRGLAERFRLPVSIPELQVNALGYRLLAEGRVDEALAAFRRNVELHPDSANVYDSLAEALERKGDLGGAVVNYEMAVRTAAVNRDPRLEIFMRRLERARRAGAGP